MDTSLFLARLIGPTLIALSAALLLNQANMRAMATDFLEHRGLIFLAGVLTLVTGLSIVLTHNEWVWGWPVVITILGWLGVVGGAFRIIFPDSVRSMGETMLDKPGLLTAGGVAEGILGVWLCYAGYLA